MSNKKSIYFIVLLIVACPFLINAVAQETGNNNNHINSGFVFYNGKYIEAPYYIECQDLAVFLNGVQITKKLKFRPKDLRVYENPGLPDSITSGAGLAALDTVRGSSGHPHMGLKVRYLYQHFSKGEAKKKIIEYFNALPYIKTVEEIHNYILKLEDYYGEQRLVGIFPPELRPPPGREEYESAVEEIKNNLITRLKKGDCFFFFNGYGEISFSRIKAARVLPRALEILKDASLNREVQKKRLESLGIVRHDNSMSEILVKGFQPNLQLDQRLKNLQSRIIEEYGPEILHEDKNGIIRDNQKFKSNFQNFPGIAYSPDGTYLYLYYAHVWDHPTTYQAEINSVTNNIKDQDYNITVCIWMDTGDDDNDPEGCTLANWRSCQFADILYIASHGGEGFFCAIYLKDSDAVDNWRGSENNILTVQSTSVSWGNPPYHPYRALVRKQWASENWNSILTQSKAIVFVNSCHSNEKENSTSFLTCCGGGVGFGYPANCNPSDRTANNNELLKRMNGTIDSGDYRMAGEAYNHMPSHRDNMEIEPAGAEITLCPATEDYFPEDGTTVNSTGTGYFQVDTYCHSTISADDALTFTTTGDVVIDNVHWIGSGTVNKIEFDWNGSGFFKVTVKANANKFQSWGAAASNYHQLDGDGIAPNGDDVEFSFTSSCGVDIALVLDRSGSMGTSGYMEPAKRSASTFVGFMQIGDQVAVASFRDYATVNFPLTLIESENTKTAAQNAIASISSGGGTSIGAGMQAGQGELDKGNTQVSQAMVLLSDGKENVAPWVDDVLQTIPENTDIYTIALGTASDESLLQNIANHTGGSYHFVPDDNALHELYLFIRSKVTGEQGFATFNGTISQGERKEHNISIDGLTAQATFSVIFEGSDVDLELRTPGGLIINPSVAASDPNITYTEGSTYDFYTISSPQAGLWTLIILGVDVPTPEHYTASVFGTSDLKMVTYFGKDNYSTGEPILINANLTENGLPITGATVMAEVTAPSTSFTARSYEIKKMLGAEETNTIAKEDGEISTNQIPCFFTSEFITLFDDGSHGDGAANDGVYANYYNNTSKDGSYNFRVEATGAASIGGQFNRVDILSLFVAPSEYTTTITVTSPNGGEVWYVGTGYPITWDADKYTGTVEVALSKDDGSNWINLTDPYYAENNGMYAYNPQPEHASENCLIRITSIENPSASDQSDDKFSIIDTSTTKKHYIAAHIPDGIPVPAIDGYLNDNAWNYALGSEVLAFGGNSNDFSIPWTNFGDNQVTWKALWSSAANTLYIAIQIQDDISGIIDNDYEHLWQDDCVELYTDGDRSGGDYSNNYAIAQQWQIRKDNAKHLNFLAGPYNGSAISSAVSQGSNGNWNLEVAMTIYNHYPSVIKQLSPHDIIGWEVWYNDSDNEHQENGSWAQDHQVGWAYSGPAYYDADYFHELELGAPSTSYFYDNFEDGNADGWLPNTPSRWSVVQDEGDYSYFLNTTGYSGGERTLLQGYAFENFELTLKTKTAENLNLINNATYTVHFCYQNEDNYYSVKFCQYNPENKLYRKKDNQSIVLATYNGTTINDNNYHEVKLKRDGNNIIVYFDQQQIMNAVDDAFINGQIGLGAWQNSAYFDDILISSGTTQKHFSPIWTGNPFQPMTVHCMKALLYNVTLEAGDEIGIFDGPKCVGSVVLNEPPTYSTYANIICSKDDGSGNGFTEGNPIIFKVWDKSGTAEYSARPQFIDLQTGQPVPPVPFTGLGTAAVELTAPGTVPQWISLKAGWNMFSLAVTPEGSHNMLDILSPILNYLVKVIDEKGNSIFKLFGNWNNSIGDWLPTEGYYTNVTQDVTLQVTGFEIATPLSIPLNTGWNIISYPCLSHSQNALNAVQPLINSGNLVKVIDEQGHSIVKIFGNWNNSIGNMQPGEGYYMNVNSNCTLTISCGGAALAAESAEQLQPLEPKHFQVGSTGYPFEPMNIFVIDARVNGENLNAGDEIAAFAGDRCVGVSVLNSLVSIDNPLEIIALQDDGNGSGFKAGDHISFKLWRSSTGEELFIDGSGVQYFDLNRAESIAAPAFKGLGTAVVAINLTTTSVTENLAMPQQYHLYQNHPNPFNPTTTISYDLPEATEVRIEIFDLQGNMVRKLVDGHQAAGHQTIEWDGRNSHDMKVVSGIYFYKLVSGKFVDTKKMILTK